jgi:hypothetical protein
MLIYGVLSFFLRNRYSALVLGGGVSLLSTMFIYKNEILSRFDSVTFFICFTMILVCIISYVFMFVTEKEINSKYDMDVLGKVIDLERNPNTKKEYYRPIYAYYLDNGEYKVGLPYYLNKKIPKIGDEISLKVSSRDHADVYFEKNLLQKIRYWGTGFGLIIICLGILISLFV